jgi:addiction module HigA family antidote
MTREPIHPGEHLAEELQELGISARELARELKVPVTRVTEILRGRRGITGDTALRLGRYFQVSPDFWMNLQKLYELDLARREIGEDLASIMPRASGRDGEGMRTLG